MVDFLPLFYSVTCLTGIGSTPVNSIPNINCRVFQARVRTKFILKATLFEQVFSKLSPTRLKKLYNPRFQFFAASLSFPHTCSEKFPLCCLWACVDWACKDTHAKSTPGIQRRPCVCRVPINVDILYPRQVYSDPLRHETHHP